MHIVRQTTTELELQEKLAISSLILLHLLLGGSSVGGCLLLPHNLVFGIVLIGVTTWIVFSVAISKSCLFNKPLNKVIFTRHQVFGIRAINEYSLQAIQQLDVTPDRRANHLYCLDVILESGNKETIAEDHLILILELAESIGEFLWSTAQTPGPLTYLGRQTIAASDTFLDALREKGLLLPNYPRWSLWEQVVEPMERFVEQGVSKGEALGRQFAGTLGVLIGRPLAGACAGTLAGALTLGIASIPVFFILAIVSNISKKIPFSAWFNATFLEELALGLLAGGIAGVLLGILGGTMIGAIDWRIESRLLRIRNAAIGAGAMGMIMLIPFGALCGSAQVLLNVVLTTTGSMAFMGALFAAPTPTNRLVKAGMDAFRQGKLPKATRCFYQAALLDPANQEIRVWLLRCVDSDGTIFATQAE